MFRRNRNKTAAATTVAAEPIDTRGLYRNLQLTSGGVWAWYRLSPVPWDFRDPGHRASILDGQTMRFADLVGLDLHIRRTTHPFEHERWARHLDRATKHPLKVPAGAPTWADYLEGAQRRVMSFGSMEPVTYMGVRIHDQPLEPIHLTCIHGGCQKEGKHERLHAEYQRVTAVMDRGGFRAAPVSARRLAWLIHGSIGMGAPVQINALAGDADTWDEGELAMVTEGVHVSAAPLSKTVTVRALRDGHEHVKHVAALTVGRMEDQDTDSPTFEPWLTASDSLPFPVEWSAHLRVQPPEEAAKKAAFNRRRAESIRSGYGDHDEPPPPVYDRGIQVAVQAEDEIREGVREVRPRLVGVIRAAVYADDPEVTMKRAGELANHYATGPRLALHHRYGQYATLREFIPAADHDRINYQRTMATYYAATAVPNAGVPIGDGKGLYLGMSGSRPVMFDPTGGPKMDRSGLTVAAGGLGSGKSTLAGTMVEGHVRCGHQAVVFDPSGPLARLGDMPALRDVTEHVELAGAEPGTLNPYWLIPDPTRDLCDTDKQYEKELREVAAERMDLMVDAMAMMLPEDLTGARGVIEEAVAEVGSEYGTNPWRVVRALEAMDAPVARAVARQMRNAAQMKGARLIFPADEHADLVGARGLGDALLTIITTRGITTPRSNDPRRWSRAERMSVPVQHLAARFAMRAMYANHRPKMVAVDEGKIATAGDSAFRDTITRGARDSRKTNTCFMVLSQNPSDLLTLDEDGELENLIGAAFVGRLNGKKAAVAGLKLLGVPEGQNYEKALLPSDDNVPGRFVMRDWNGNVGVVDVDLGWRLDLLDALNTTPPSDDASDRAEPHWSDDLDLAVAVSS